MSKISKQDFQRKYNFHNDDLVLLKLSSFQGTGSNLVGKSQTFIKNVLKRFFLNIFATTSLIIFVLVILISILVPLFSPYSSVEPISKADLRLVQNLQSSLNNNVVESVSESKFLLYKQIEEQNGIKIISDFTKLGNNYFITYNPYAALQALSPDKTDFISIVGTDTYGRDLWLRTWEGTRNAFILSFVVSVVRTTIGITIGSYMGFHVGKRVDTFFMRIVDIVNSIPWFLIFIILVAIFGKDLITIGAILIILGWTESAYMSRMFMITIKDEEFLQASKSVGSSKLRIIYREALPQIIGKLLATFVSGIVSGIFALSSLSFLGLISDGPSEGANLGIVLTSAREYYNNNNIWALLVPTLILITLTISVKIVSIGVHDALDPKTKKVS